MLQRMRKYSILACFFLTMPLVAEETQQGSQGLNDLTQALEQLGGTSPLKAIIYTSTTESRGDGDDIKTELGEIEIQIEDNQQGLHVSYSNQVLDLLEYESNLKEQDEEAKTPTLNGLNATSTNEIRNLLYQNSRILRDLKGLKLKQESLTEYQGKMLRKLTFKVPLEKIVDDKKVRGYVNKFTGTYDVIIDEQGVPQESQLTFKGKGRAYIVLSMKMKASIVARYQVLNNRLLLVERESTNSYESTFGDSTYKEINRLHVLGAPAPLVSTSAQ